MPIPKKKTLTTLAELVGSSLNFKTSNTPWGLTALYNNEQALYFQPRPLRGSLGLWAEKLGLVPKTSSKKIFADLGENVFELFTPSCQDAWLKAEAKAARLERAIGAEELFLTLIQTPEIGELCMRLNVTSKTAENFLHNYLKLTTKRLTEIRQLPFEAYVQAAKLHSHTISPLIMLLAMLKALPEQHILQAIFTNIGLTYQKLEILTVWLGDLEPPYQKNTKPAIYLNCCFQSRLQERLFGYFFTFDAIDQAVHSARGNPYAVLVRVGLLAKKKRQRNITANLVLQAVHDYAD